jgi:hypothetical protein
MADGDDTRAPYTELIPRPDPTRLTTEAVARATDIFRRELQALRELHDKDLAALRELLDARSGADTQDRAKLWERTEDLVRRFTDALTDFRAEMEHRDRANRELVEQRLGDLDKSRTDAAASVTAALASEREYIESRIGALRDTLEQRLGAMDIATRVLAGSVEKFPTDIDRAVDSGREVMMGEIRRVGDVTQEKFAAVDALFASNALALAAALAAQEKAVAAQNDSNTLAISKSESTTKEAIAANQATARTGLESLTSTVSDIKDRVVRMESAGVGAAGQRTDQRAGLSTIFAAIATLAAVISFVLLIVKP